MTPMTSSSTARPSVTPRFCPAVPGDRSVASPGAVLGVELLVALGHRLQRVVGLLAGRVRAQPVPFGAAVPRLDRVVLQAVEPRTLLGHRHLLLASALLSQTRGPVPGPALSLRGVGRTGSFQMSTMT